MKKKSNWFKMASGHPFIKEPFLMKFYLLMISLAIQHFPPKNSRNAYRFAFAAIPPVKFTKQRRQTPIIVTFNKKRLFSSFEHYHLWCFPFSRRWMKITRASRQWSEIIRRLAVCLWFGGERNWRNEFSLRLSSRKRDWNRIFMRAVSTLCDAWGSSTRLAEVKQQI